MNRPTQTLLASCLLAALAAPVGAAPASGERLQDWPRVHSAIATDAQIESRVQQILSQMTLAQKIGQMTQAEIKTITPEQVRRYYIGSVLNGGGSWPGMDKHASVQDWLKLADAYHAASLATDAKTPVPVIWGTDAVHGHNNVLGATLFPHNIGLGAAGDPELIERIGEATARSVRATGIGWVFAPTLAVAHDPRWGRTYESYSSDPAVIRSFAHAYVKGAQGAFKDDGNVVTTAKHYLGDGATDSGRDQGEALVDKATMINVHAQGYYGALAEGAQTVMASFNSWNDRAAGVDYGKMHGSKALLTDALKDKMGFDGFVVSDWNGIAQVPGCRNDSCAHAINAGIDMVMVPDDWKAFIDNTTAQVQKGEIPMARIDDAVTRILRVKLRAGLFEHKPSDSRYAGDASAVQHRELARRAVRESLVLLKNEGKVLPLRRDARVLVVGKGADNIGDQSGGWSLTWQGTENKNADFPNADSVLGALRAELGADKVSFSADGQGVDPKSFDVVLAVIGETPYAETNGDILASDTVSHSRAYPQDLAALKAAAATGKPVVTVYLSGRPMYTNDLLNLSSAFVAAWLPGTEGKGVADVLVAGKGGKPAHDFRGRLSFPWPGVPCPAPIDQPDAKKPSLFALGYGLSYAKGGKVARLEEADPDSCGEVTVLPIFNRADTPPFALHVAAAGATQPLGNDLNATLRWPTATPVVQVRTVQVNTQQDAKEVTWLAPAQLIARSTSRRNLGALARSNGALQFDVQLVKRPASPVKVTMQCGIGCEGGVDIAPLLGRLSPGQKQTVTVPLACFAKQGVALGAVEAPFVVSADKPFAAAFTQIKLTANTANAEGAVACP
ncbi:glycoside hydrolase family 3 protein [Stenotrophomonas sp. YAU14A_MKIMI4_1]|uniref:glycoside hydrolase family 3 protein n=1 Tax=Stenotrophomonas sp. YAU14A_MKIMI4_1 TaxID=2072408 RepID=UPI000D53C585|nr:glycoside hydrolase family 3 protein [Stenotrophomonas sp. YAU14A_MKIMI4_1]AWH30731.1 beta-glucosidase [Stenotrophomonas sp. YAU14A_MKIMI4_1]